MGYKSNRLYYAVPMVPQSLQVSLDDLLSRKAIHSVSQAIIDLRSQNALGYEILSRGPNGHLLQRLDVMFQAAHQFDRVLELDQLCLFKGIEHFAHHHHDALIFINFSPES